VQLPSDKYLAGFLDGDGSLTLAQGKYLWLEMHQMQARDGVIELARQALFPQGRLHTRDGRRRGTRTVGTRLVITGQKAVDQACRLKPYLVAKRVRLNQFLRELGFTERVGTDSIPVYPSRKWLAGYFDADGCISACVNRHGGSASLAFSIDADVAEQDGLELVQKAFGGRIYLRGVKGARWEMKADAAQARAFLTPFAKHLILKREQAYFVLGCAAMGHFRDGRIITDTLKAMKTHPHRLSDLTAEVDVSGFLAKVRDLQPEPGRRYRSADGQMCSSCGTRRPYARGLCNPCWQQDRYTPQRSKRQSEQLTLFGANEDND